MEKETLTAKRLRPINAAIHASKRGPCALFAAEAKRTVKQAVREPLEPNRNFVELSAELRCDAINPQAAHHYFAYRRLFAPLWPMLEEVEDGNRKVKVGRQQSRASGDDSVPVMVGVAGEGKVETILPPYLSLHRIGRGRIHAYLISVSPTPYSGGNSGGQARDRMRT